MWYTAHTETRTSARVAQCGPSHDRSWSHNLQELTVGPLNEILFNLLNIGFSDQQEAFAVHILDQSIAEDLNIEGATCSQSKNALDGYFICFLTRGLVLFTGWQGILPPDSRVTRSQAADGLERGSDPMRNDVTAVQKT